MEKLTKKLNDKSRRLIKALRHEPESLWLILDKDGFANVLSVIKGLEITYNDLELIVKLNDKQRFEIIDDKIRALQGHSVEIDETSLSEYNSSNFGSNQSYSQIVYHGTTESVLEDILNTGISKMKRQFVQCSQDEETAIKVASRHGNDVVILKININRSYSPWYVSNNGVILTEHVSPNAIVEVIYQCNRNLFYTDTEAMYSNIILTPDGTIMKSRYNYDYVEHKDKNGKIYTLDGGTDYQRGNNITSAIDLSVYEGACHDVIREHIVWGTTGIDGKLSLLHVKVADMELDHIFAIIKTQSRISMKLFKVLTNELIYRKGHDEI